MAVSGEYRAFISYSHADKVVARRLHHALEHFRIPKRLIGRETAIGPVPHRLAPIFLDRSELPASGHLSSELEAALRASRFLIPICSPNAVGSRWVAKEIEAFRAIHGAERILPLIAEGRAPDCFPAPLKADGAEPVAADMRPTADGWRAAVLKLAAGLLGVPYDELAQREAAERTRRARLVAGGSSTLAIAMAALALVAVDARREAEAQRTEAEGLVEYMLTDLRRKLEPVGRLEVLDGVGQRALSYYAEQDAGEMDADGLGRRARAQHLVGEVSDLRGDGRAALAAFTEAAKTTAELLARDPDNPDRIFDHAQSVFWVAIAERQRFNVAATEARLREYRELTARLAPMDPKNALWQSERASGHLNLGVHLLETGRLEEAAAEFALALPIQEALARAAPDDRQAQIYLGTAHAWTADAAYHRGRLDEAEAARRREVAIYRQLLARDDEDAGARDQLHVATFQLGTIALARRELSSANTHATEALRLATTVAEGDPANEDYAVNEGHAQLLLRRIAGTQSGRLDAGAIEAIAREAEARNPPDLSKRRVALLACSARAWAAEAHLAAGNTEAARQSAARSAALAERLRTADPIAGGVRNHHARALLVAAEAWATEGDRAQAKAVLAQAERVLGEASDLEALQLRYRLAVAAGDAAAAAAMAARLEALGIRVAN